MRTTFSTAWLVATLGFASSAVAEPRASVFAGSGEEALQVGGPVRPMAATVSASSVGTTLRIVIQGFVSYCSPAPQFAVNRTATELRLRMVIPPHPSRCVSPHTVTVDVPELPAGRYTVIVESGPAQPGGDPVVVTRGEFTHAPTH